MSFSKTANGDELKLNTDKKQRRMNFLFFAVIFVIINLLTVLYITRSNFIYFWDNATYWDIGRRIAKVEMGPEFLKTLYASISNMDYNYLAGLLPALIIRIFGESRLVYVLTLVNAYLIPTFIIIYLIINKIGKAPKITLILTILLCPALTFMAFVGFVDVGAMLGAFVCFYIYFSCKELKPHYALIIGVTLLLMMLYRRWYAFFAVSFITSMFADSIINKKNLINPVISALTVGILLFLCFRDFTFNILLADYGDLYSDYKFSLSTDLKLITRYFGFIYLLVLVVASALIIIKKRDTRPIFMWVQIISCAVMFMFLQTHGQQHLLLYIPSLIMLTILLVKYINKEWMLVLISCLAVIHSVNVYIPYKQPDSIKDIKLYAPVPNFSMRARIRDDTDDILKLKKSLDNIVGEGETLGVLASSFALNEDVLRNVEPSLNCKKERDDYIVSLPQVDSRDSDFSVYGRVNYILVTNPVQTHLLDGSQTCVEEAQKSFIEWTDIARAYEEIYDEETNINGINIKLFKRVKEIPEYDYEAFYKRINK